MIHPRPSSWNVAQPRCVVHEECNLVNVAPEPVLFGFERLDDGGDPLVLACADACLFGRVATSDVATIQAHA